MTFADLLKAKDEATEHEEKAVAALTDAEASLEAAQAHVNAAHDEAAQQQTKAEADRAASLAKMAKDEGAKVAKARAADKAAAARAESRQAIFDHLANEGPHYVTEADGSTSVYFAQEISDTSPGWRVLKPKPAEPAHHGKTSHAPAHAHEPEHAKGRK